MFCWVKGWGFTTLSFSLQLTLPIVRPVSLPSPRRLFLDWCTRWTLTSSQASSTALPDARGYQLRETVRTRWRSVLATPSLVQPDELFNSTNWYTQMSRCVLKELCSTWPTTVNTTSVGGVRTKFVSEHFQRNRVYISQSGKVLGTCCRRWGRCYS